MESNKKTTVDIWAIVERSIQQSATPAVSSSPDSSKSSTKLSKWNRLAFRIADLVCASLWIYAFTALFLIDIGNSFQRLLTVLGLVFLISVFRWKWWTLLLVGYLLFFPLIVIFWKVPRFIYKRRSLILAIVTLNATALFFKNLRYNLITKTSGFVALILILRYSNHLLLALAAAYALLLLLWSSARTLKNTIHSDWFLQLHKKGFDRILGSGIYKAITAVDEKLLSGELQVLDTNQLSSFNMAITARMTANRGLLLWAYGLQRYRQARLAMAFNGIAYAAVFIGALICIWLVNVAVLKIDPSQFTFVTHPSNIAMLLYTLSSFAMSDGGGVSAAGDVADLVRIFVGIYAFLFLSAFLVNLVMVSVQRDDSSLSSLVSTLKAEARAEEERFQEQYALGIAEAHSKLVGLQQKIVGLVTLLNSAIPSEFLEDIENTGEQTPQSKKTRLG